MTRSTTAALVASGALAALVAAGGCRRPSTEPGDAGAETGPPSTAADASAMNALGLPPEDVAKFVNPEGLPAYAGPTGSVEGTIFVKGPPAPDTPGAFDKCPDAARIYGKLFREGQARPDGTRPLVDTIVAVTGYAGFFVPEREEDARVEIDGCGFSKRTVTMTFGQRLEVKNLTGAFWSPMLDPAPNPVIMMAAPKGDPVRLYPKRPGRFRLHDHDRAYAVADLYAMLHPLHAVTDGAGHYRVDGVPVGTLKVNARHPKFEAEAAVDIDVRPNVVVQADLTLEYAPIDAGAPDADRSPQRPKLR